MNKDTQPTLHFYQGDQLHTALGETISRTLLRNQHHPLAEQQSQAGRDSTKLLATDAQDSVLQARAGQEAQSSSYTAYGKRPFVDVRDALAGFNGESRDLLTGCYLLGNGYRSYNPISMRFNSPDNYSPFGSGGMNTYMYCKGDPVNLADPTGHSPWKPRPTPVTDQGIYRPRPQSRPAQGTDQRQPHNPLAHSRHSVRAASSNAVAAPTLTQPSSRPMATQPFYSAMDLSQDSRLLKLNDKVRDAIANNHHLDTKAFYTDEYRNYKEFRRAAAGLIIETEKSVGQHVAIQGFFAEWPQTNVEKVRNKILSEVKKLRAST